jgi:GntR family transcriptional regulator / MocR family aminotransferase
LLASPSANLGDAMTVVGADAGLHVVVWLNRMPKAQEDALIERAHAAGLGLYPVTPLYASAQTTARPDRAGLVMGYASLNGWAIKQGVRTLKEVLETFAADKNAGCGPG